MKRSNEQLWHETLSCLGGVPKLDRREWPRQMHCVAQIDLNHVARLGLNLETPKDGYLAFFADTGSFSGSLHRGAVLELSADQIGLHENNTDPGPIYGQDWQYYDASQGACGYSDAPRCFPRWPLVFTASEQSSTSNDEFKPSLEDVFGPETMSVHLPLKGLVEEREREGYFYPVDDASPFPTRAAQMILNHCARMTKTILSSGGGAQTDAATLLLKQMSENIVIAEGMLEILKKWQEVFSSLNPDEPLGAEYGSAFTMDLAQLQDALRSRNMHINIGSGTTVTGGAALAAYFAMYCGHAQSFQAIPDNIRAYIEAERMRTAYSNRITHQIGGHGANVQENEMAQKGMILLLQVATDEAVGFMWGDVGVLQYWIHPADLAQRKWENVQFLVHGH